VRRELLTRQSGNDALQNDICITLAKIGQTLTATGDVSGALAAHHEALDMRRALADKHPDNAGWCDDVAWSEERISELLERLQIKK